MKNNYSETCVKIRLFGEEDKLNTEFLETLTDDLCDYFVSKGYSNEEDVDCIITINPDDKVPEGIDSEGVVEFLHGDENSAWVVLPNE